MKRMYLGGTFTQHTRTRRQFAVELLVFVVVLAVVFGALAWVALMAET